MSASREKKKRQGLTDADVAPSTAGTKKGLSSTGKKVLYSVIAVVAVAVIVFFSLVSTGFFVTHTVAASVGSHDLSPAMVNYFYGSAYQNLSNTYGEYLSMFIDTSKPLDEQAYMTEDYATWHDYLLDSALKSAYEAYAIYDEAMANGYTLSEEEQSAIDSQISSLDLYAAMYGYGSGQAYLAANYGTGSSVDSFREYVTITTVAGAYANQIANDFSYSADDIAAYYSEHTEDFDAVTFRVYPINVPAASEEEGEEEVDTEAALAECETKAKEMAEASQGDEQAFLDYTVEYADEASKETYEDESTTLREDYTLSSTVEAYRDWLADDARQPGDATYVQNGELGYYVLYFVGQSDRTFQLPNVRHILVQVSDTSDEEAMTAAKEEAQEILDEFLAGDATEDAFAALADEKSDDTSEGGLIENIAPGAMVESFEDWAYDESRQAGDTGIIESEYGYHVMYFCGYGDVYRDYLVENTLRTNDYNAWYEEVTAGSSYTTYGFPMMFVKSR